MADARGFWSYTHDDDAAVEGRIRALAERLATEYGLITGSRIDLFVDRSDIKWGDEWRRTIDTALRDTTFFMPIITPRYFLSRECRRELLDFYGAANSLGLGQLILPIRYVAVPDLREDNADDLISLVSKMQYVDWTELRIESLSSPDSRRAVKEMADRVAALVLQADQIQLSRDVALTQAGSAGDDNEGLVELVSEIEKLLPDWLDAVMDDRMRWSQFRATQLEYVRRFNKLVASGAPQGARLSLLYQQAGYELPLLQKRLELAKIYAAKTTELDPLVTKALRIVVAYPETKSLLNFLVDAVSEACQAIADSLGPGGWDPDNNNTKFWQEQAHLGKVAKAVADASLTSDRFVDEANTTMLRWASEMGMSIEGLSMVETSQSASVE